MQEVISKITYHFLSLFKDDMSTQPEKGHLLIVDDELLAHSKRRKDNDDITQGEILWLKSFSIYIYIIIYNIYNYLLWNINH